MHDRRGFFRRLFGGAAVVVTPFDTPLLHPGPLPVAKPDGTPLPESGSCVHVEDLGPVHPGWKRTSIITHNNGVISYYNEILYYIKE